MGKDSIGAGAPANNPSNDAPDAARACV